MSTSTELTSSVICKKSGLHAALYGAIRSGDINLVKCIIDKFGVNFRSKWIHGYSLLYEAILSKQFDIAHFLLDMGAAVNLPEKRKLNLDKINKSINSALHLAVEHDDIKLIYSMLSKGCDVNYSGTNREKPLHVAVRCNNLEAVKALLEYKSDINCTDYFNATPIYMAVDNENGSLAMLHSLGQYNPDLSISTSAHMNPLLMATAKNKTHVVRYLLDVGADHNVEDGYGRTVLSIASENGCEDLCRLFISKGCDINKCDRVGRTPLHHACKYSYVNITRLLLRAGCEVNIKDNKGASPLHLAANHISGNTAVAQLLLNYGANPNSLDLYKSSPLHWAVQMNFLSQKGSSYDMVRLLLENGADPNSVDKWGCSPLYLTAINCDTDKFSLLICYGGDVNQRYSDSTPLSGAPWEEDNPPFEFYNYIHHCAVKWKYLGLLNISDENMNSLSPNSLSVFEIYRKQCQDEIDNIRNYKYNLYSLLTKPINDVAYFIINGSIREYIFSEECMEKFPLYHSIMKIRWRQAEIRYKLLQECQEFYQWFENMLPNCVKLILSYVSNSDLKSLSKW